MVLALAVDVIQGPERSALLGKHLRIDPTCSTTRPNQFPTQAFVITNSARRIIELSKGGEKLDSLAVMGTQDPALNTDFRAISENLRELANKWYAKADLWLFTDAVNLTHPDRRIALGQYDKPVVRFSAGTQKTFAALTGAKAGEFKQAAENLSRIELERLTVEALFVRGDVDNTTDSELKNWLRYVAAARPGSVLIRTLDKPDAKRKQRPVTPAALETLANTIGEKLGVPCEVVAG